MLKLRGKTVVFTDIHFGARYNSEKKLEMCLKSAKFITDYVNSNNISNVIFTGDFIDSRNQVDIRVMSCAYNALEKMTENANFYLILGNHDIYYKSNSSVYSSSVFRNIKNVTIVSEATEAEINGKTALFVPWNSNLNPFSGKRYDFMFGHLEKSEDYHKTDFIKTNIARNASPEDVKKLIEEDELLAESGFDDMEFKEITDKMEFKDNPNDTLDGFTDLVKVGGTIFCGHIHNHKEFVVKGREFIFVGSPYQLNFGEMDSKNGLYCIEEDGTYGFIENNDLPVHVEVRVSDLMKDDFDYSRLSGNIIKKIYDVNVDDKTEDMIRRRILDSAPFEEQSSKIVVREGEIKDSECVAKNISLLRGSMLDYIKEYVNDMDSADLEKKKLSKNRMIEMLTKYYEANENKHNGVKTKRN